LQSFELSGKPHSLYNAVAGAQYFASDRGTCNDFLITDYDEANARWTATYENKSDFLSIPACQAAVGELYYENYFKQSTTLFKLDFDVSSFITAMAVSYGVQVEYCCDRFILYAHVLLFSRCSSFLMVFS
jgi:hypothetical protein